MLEHWRYVIITRGMHHNIGTKYSTVSITPLGSFHLGYERIIRVQIYYSFFASALING